jgi:hypothetical protein
MKLQFQLLVLHFVYLASAGMVAIAHSWSYGNPINDQFFICWQWLAFGQLRFAYLGG